jgi:glycosyltransferase involved in cell wall biosynthesis
VENRPRSPLYYGGSLKFHLGHSLYGLAIVAQALRDRASVIIVDSGTAHWFVFSLLSLFRIPVIAVMHNALWPLGFPPTRKSDRLFRWLDGWFFRHFAAATVCVSPECERQVRAVAGSPKGSVYQCLPQYRRAFMTCVPAPPDPASRPFRVLFLGRVEDFKGVFLILSMAERLEAEMPGQFLWKIVGEGRSSDALIRETRERNLHSIVEIPGSLPDEETALATLGWAHAMVVPTTSRFPEGLAMTAAEAILAGRPVVLSSVVPAYEILGAAAIRVEPDRTDGFVAALRKLALEPDYYRQCQRATASTQAQFYDRSKGLGAVLGRAISALP